MGIMDKLNNAVQQTVGTNIIQGVMGNMSEATPESLSNEYGAFLMDGEVIQIGYKLIRDVVIFTDKRIIDIDKQGATGTKACFNTIYLDSIINVSAETAGFGLDDSEINITYITSPYFKANNGVSLAERKFEFPKRYNIQPLYKMLQTIALENHKNINK